MLKDLVKEVLSGIIGKQADEFVDVVFNKDYVNEFNIAKKLNLTINQTRNILYRVSDHGLVSYTRKKDEKKGWYTYFWKLNSLKSLYFLQDILLKKKREIGNLIETRESKIFYICDRCKIELSEDDALLQEFSCPECGDVLSIKDDVKLIENWKKMYSEIEEKLKLVEEEIKKENEKIEKQKEKEKEKAKKKAAKKKTSKKKTTKKKTAKKKTTGKKKTSGKKVTKKKLSKKKTTKKKTKKKTSKKKVAKKKTSKKKTSKKKTAKKKTAKKKVAKKKTTKSKKS
jgi:transcription factor E